MKLHIVQKNINNTDLTPFLDRAKEAQVDAICFGELATSGCLYAKREVEDVETVLTRFRPYSFAIMTGLPLQTDKGLRNSYLYYHSGSSQLYHKINLFPPFNEPDIFVPGTEPGLFKTHFGRIGVAICYDLRFEEVFAELKRLQAEIVIIPAAFPRTRIDEYRALLFERVRETATTVIGVNAVGDDGRHVFGGSSMVITPGGNVLARADETSETVLEVKL